VTLDYRPARGAPEAEFVSSFRRACPPIWLGAFQPRPHRDELALLRDGQGAAASTASQGEQRLALLALLLAEREVIARERRRTPLMLLDE